MPLAVIAGMPNGKAQEHSPFLAAHSFVDGWTVTWIPARSNRADLTSCWPAACLAADGADDEGAHIFAYHKTISERGRFEADIRFRHRLIWLDTGALYGDVDGLWRDIRQELDLEREWREIARPRSVGHPLILPRTTFASKFDPWTTAQRARTPDTFGRTRKEMERFQDTHRHHACWRDLDRLVFDFHGERHRRAQESQRWKFTYRVDADFHYDVAREDRRPFTIRSASGEHLRFTQYTNVDTHGQVMDGA